jgi:hypothetical protein
LPFAFSFLRKLAGSQNRAGPMLGEVCFPFRLPQKDSPAPIRDSAPMGQQSTASLQFGGTMWERLEQERGTSTTTTTMRKIILMMSVSLDGYIEGLKRQID